MASTAAPYRQAGHLRWHEPQDSKDGKAAHLDRTQERERHVHRARLDGLDGPRRGHLRVGYIASCRAHRPRHIVVVAEESIRAPIDADEAYPSDDLGRQLDLHTSHPRETLTYRAIPEDGVVIR